MSCMLEIQNWKLKPLQGFVLSKGFYDVIALDLKVIDKINVLHIADDARRFITTAEVKSKKKLKTHN